eukprot:COSAG03_NODE_199_length_10789_cov_369.743312_11_plen_63_part_00
MLTRSQKHSRPRVRVREGCITLWRLNTVSSAYKKVTRRMPLMNIDKYSFVVSYVAAAYSLYS